MQTGPNYDGGILGERVKDVTYTLKQVESFDGRNWTEVTDAEEFTMVTGEEGRVTKSGMALGRYEVRETGTPDHIIENTETFYVDIPMTYDNGTKFDYNVTINPKNETILADGEIEKKEIMKAFQVLNLISLVKRQKKMKIS